MGRGKIEMKKIENQTNRQVTFSKRRAGLLKKAHELSVLCDAQVGLIIFSSTGKTSEYCSEPLSMGQIIEKYKNAKGDHTSEPTGDLPQTYNELARMKRENHQLELSLKLYNGDDLSSIQYEDLDQLEQQLECSINKVRARKDQLLQQQLNNLQRKLGRLGEENDQLRSWIEERQVALVHQQAITKTMEQQVLDQFPFFGEAQPSSVPQLATLPQYHPYLLQSMQPNLQESSFQRNNND